MSHILIAEDDPSTRELLSEMLKQTGHHLIMAEDGSQAIELIKKEKIDLVILDIGMPNIDGIEALTRIRKISTTVPIIILSVWDDQEYKVISEKNRTFDYMQKPFNVNDLLKKINQVLKSEKKQPEPPPKEKKVSIKPVIQRSSKIILAWFVVGILVFIYAFTQTRDRVDIPLSFNLSYKNPTGAAWDGKHLWISDWSTQSIYKHKIDPSLTLLKTYTEPDLYPVTISWGDFILWSVGQDGMIRKRFPLRNLSASKPIPVDGTILSAIAWDGKNIWSCNRKEKKIHRHILNKNFSIDVSYNYPGQDPVGLTWVKENLWVADEGTGSIYQFNYRNGVFTLSGTFVPKMHGPGGSKLSGITSDGENLWTISEGEGKVFRHPLATIPETTQP